MMKPVELKKGIYWVGVVDWNLRDFHGYKTPNGTTYNAYLVVDEKIALIDTVKKQFKDELVRNVSSLVDLDKIDYLVVNHVEMDHSGSFPDVAALLPNAKIVATPEGKEELAKHHGDAAEVGTVDNGDTISLGSKTLTFIKTPMLHWPDSMMTYIPEDKVLFSSDGFGQHYASSLRFSDEVDETTLRDAAGDYYANILWLYSPLITRLLSSVADMGLDIDIIAPDHGFIWRGNLDKALSWYGEWSSGSSASDKVIIAYETMWNSTERMAKAIAEALAESGLEVRLMRLRDTENSFVLAELLDAKALLVGTPTLNNGMFPSIGGLLTYLRGLRPKKKVGAVFGSYGWGGGGCSAAEELLGQSGIDVVMPAMELKWVPTESELAACAEWAREFATKVKGQ
jgi:flavorubredoxin